MVGNVVVGQSGGPTSVINSSLAGVYKTAKDLGAPKVYGMRHGIQGFLERNLVDLDDKLRSEMDIELLKRTPSAYLGSCRFKLPEYDANPEMYNKIFALLIPFIFLTSFIYAAAKKTKVYDSFVQGAGKAIPLIVSIFP